jgi:hypothetical protein
MSQPQRKGTAMLAAKYVLWLSFVMLIAFWRLNPWTWLVRLAQMPLAYSNLMALEPDDRVKSIEAGVGWLATARETGDVWMPKFVWRRICALVGRPA